MRLYAAFFVGGFLAAAAFVPWALSASTRTAASVPLGDYAGYADPSGVAAFGQATGTQPTLATDYLDYSNGWSGMDSASGLGAWKGYRLVLGVPLIPDGSGATLAQGATGAYNQDFTTLAQNLVNQGEGNAVLRLGWEFNGTWYAWSVASSTDAANFVAYWQQIVTAMRSVPGQSFSFLWNPNSGSNTSYSPAAAYPGNAYVDYIGTDIYDEYWGSPMTPQAAWGNQLSEQWGLNWLTSFASANGKPIAIPEWGVSIRSDGHGLGDDPYFVNEFGDWIGANNVAFTNIFSFNDSAGGQDDDITDGNFPNALAAFRQDFAGASAALGSGSPNPAPAPAPNPAPAPAPAAPAPAPAPAAPAPAPSPLPVVKVPAVTVPSLPLVSRPVAPATAHSPAVAPSSTAAKATSPVATPAAAGTAGAAAVTGAAVTPPSPTTPAAVVSHSLPPQLAAGAHPASAGPASVTGTPTPSVPVDVSPSDSVAPAGLDPLPVLGMFFLGGLAGLGLAYRRQGRHGAHLSRRPVALAR